MNTAAPVILGLIGAGRWGRNIIRTVGAMDGVSLVAIASANLDTQTLAGPAARITPDWHEVVSDRGLDGVIIATPPALHAEIAEAALAAGRAVFVEKPLTLDIAEARALYAVAEAARGIVIVDHIHLFNPAYVVLKAMAHDLGPIRTIRSAGGATGPFRHDIPVLWDWGAHDVAMAMDLIGAAPENVSATMVERATCAAGDAALIDLVLDFEGGVAATARVGNLMPVKQRRLEVCCADGRLVFDDFAEHKLVEWRGAATGDAASEVVAVAPLMPLSEAIAAFTRAIRAGGPNLSSLALAVEVVAVLARCEARLARA